jgi:hypothetical protein
LTSTGADSFANRDWYGLELRKERYWAERKSSMTPAEALQVADDLRQWVRSLRPDWPSAEERREDLTHHTYLSNALRSVAKPPSS